MIFLCDNEITLRLKSQQHLSVKEAGVIPVFKLGNDLMLEIPEVECAWRK